MNNTRNKPFMYLLILILVLVLALVLHLKNVFGTHSLASTESVEIIPLKATMAHAAEKPNDDEIELRLLRAYDSNQQQGRTNTSLAIDFTLKTACRVNVMTINRAVEQWFLLEGDWPKDDLSDIGRNRDYFPNGIPRCPVSGSSSPNDPNPGEPYRLDPQTHRVMGHAHDEIPSVTDPKDFFVQK